MITASRHLSAALAWTLGLLICSAAASEDASRWDGDARSAVRLIAGLQSSGGAALRAGIEIRLKPGWHTYWRYPGDAGVPPHFDFAGSTNLKSVELLWPAPQRLVEDGAVTIGYDRDVILPLAVVALNAAKPVTLRLKIDYAICEKQCVPAEGQAVLVLSGRQSVLEPLIAAAERRVPKKLGLGEGRTLVIRSVQRGEDGGRARIAVEVAGPAHGTIELFAEGPNPNWALPVPTPVGNRAAGLQRFTFELDGAPPGADYKGARITLTAVAGEDAIEASTHLD